MLKIINNLQPFFEDCYRRINVREYAKLMKISPPTASKLLADYQQEGLLQKEPFRKFHFYHANRENKTFRDLSRLYWQKKLKNFLAHLNNKLLDPTIILFGSLAKAEVTEKSDIDIAIISKKKELNITPFEKELQREIEIIWIPEPKKTKNKELTNNILNGYILKGRMVL